MPLLVSRNKAYEVGDEDFLMHPDQWDESFVEAMASRVEIKGGVTASHWEVIKFIRDVFSRSGRCPLVHETCKALGLRTLELSRLFPTGYLRGACKLAGITYREQEIHPSWLAKERSSRVTAPLEDRVYRVNIRGFLVDSSEWDEDFAIHKSREMKMAGSLTERHWQIIRFLRQQYGKTGMVPTVYETCTANHLEIEELGELFPDGYHRGAVKLAGLRAI
jgi:tRNA 2-thiouridine synthesizing protein E